MFDGIEMRVVSLWFPRLSSDRVLRQNGAALVERPFAVHHLEKNAERIRCLNHTAQKKGVHPGMSLADARAFCPDLVTRPADPASDGRLLEALRRWALRYCPWVGVEGRDGLNLNITGSAHLFGGEAALLADIRQRLLRAGIEVRIGLGDSRGAAWALAHHGEGVARPGAALDALGDLPVAALRLTEDERVGLERLGLRRVGALAAAARAPLARRFGAGLLLRLDQALGRQPEAITPLPPPPHYGVRLSLPEPIGLIGDLEAGARRLLERLCETLKAQEKGARKIVLTLARVDQESQKVELCLARALRDPDRILALLGRGLADVEAGFGIDMMRLEAVQVEAMPPEQLRSHGTPQVDRLDDLITRVGARIGLEHIHRFLPADSHIPERSFIVAAAAYSMPEGPWVAPRPRPIRMFPPEPVVSLGRFAGLAPPRRFRWRGMSLCTARATGPERLTPEWWLTDEAWDRGMRDYWRVETREGRRLWLYHTPQRPGWFAHGEFA